MADHWLDPLRDLIFITDHPSRRSSIASDALSSVLSDPEAFADRHQQGLERLKKYTTVSESDSTAELLGIFLQHLPKAGQASLLYDILEAGDDQNLRTLRNHLVDAILKPMILAGGKVPITPPLDPLAKLQIDLSMTQIESSTRADQKSLKDKSLKRDGYQCAITHWYDLSRRREITIPVGAKTTTRTACAHILPFALRKFDESNATETQNKATIWWALHRYFPALEKLIDASSINRPENVITLNHLAHEAFGDYEIAFWPTRHPNKYQIHCFSAYEIEGTQTPLHDKVVKLVSKDPSVPLPNAEYFKVHCQVAEILHKAKETWTVQKKERLW